jgi:LuxR family transcriptional regulator, maltose regulon positive regulatory protein
MAVIAATKLQAPGRRGLVPRRELLERLVSSEARLILLAAPPGSGKTSILSQWAAAGSRPFAWLALDEEDDDPVRFWTCVVEALRTVRPDAGGAALGALAAPGVELVEVVVPLLVNELLDWPETVLALDDYHVIRDEEIHRSLTFLLDHLPAQISLALATRSDPPLPVARLRARGQLTELRAAELRFNGEEAAAFLGAGLAEALSAADIDALLERTEGWAAGLQLAGLSLRGGAEPARAIAALRGDHRHVVEYIATDVLAGVPSALREFLLRTSILDRLEPALCEEVTGEAGAAEALEECVRRGLFTLPLDAEGRWYRYHRLFADVLRHELEVRYPALLAELHTRAGRWLEAAGFPEEAIRHALAAGDTAGAAELVAGHWSAYFNRGWLTTVARWLDALPEETVERDSRLWLAQAWTAMDRGRLDEIAPWLEAGASRPGAREGERRAWAALLTALHRFKSGDVGGARDALAAAREEWAEPSRFWSTVAALVDGLSCHWSGDVPGARRPFSEAAALAERDANRLAALYALGYLALGAAAGAQGPAAQSLGDARALIEAEPQLDEHFTAMVAHLAAGRAALAERRTEEGVRECARAVELSRRGAGVVETAAALAEHARALRATGAVAEADRRLAEARGLVESCPDPGALRELVAAHRAPRNGHRDELTDRELGVLRLLPSELSLREIGAELFVSLNTVKTHVRSIYLKLGAASREQAVARAREEGLI